MILYPIIDTQNRTTAQNNTNQFKGAILAGISSKTLDSFLQSQTPPLASANLSLVDSTGMMIVAGIPDFVGTSVFDKKFDSMVGRSSNDNIRGKNIVDLFRSAVQSPRGVQLM